MKTLFISLLVFIGLGLSASPQVKSHKELKGDKSFFVYSFEKAIDAYTHTKNLTTEGQRRLAESYHNLNQNDKAEIAYAKLITLGDGVLPEDYYDYAMILKNEGKTEQSNTYMDKFYELKQGDLRAQDYERNKTNINNLSKDNGNYKIQHLDVNTDAEDFGTSYYKNEVVFASSREKPKMVVRKYNWNGQPFLDVYVSEVDQNQLKKPENFNKKLNGKLHDGPASFSKDGNMVAFTRNNYDVPRKDKVVELQIWFSNFTDGKWSDPVPFSLNNTDYSVGHPCLSADGNTMYFTSDMPGGYGGADIYRVTKTGNEWGKAENLGDKINTEGDELFPFYEENNGILFFSSNGRFGLGGLDIFICALNGSEIGPIVNPGSPMNTTSDDFAAIVDDQAKKGYFSSNRAGGNGDDDIYSFDVIKLDIGKKIKGIAKDAAGVAIPKTFITLTDDKNNVIDTVTTKDDGAYTFLVAADKNFKLIGKKENYSDGENIANTFGAEFVVTADVVLTKKETVAQIVPVETDLGKIAALKSIYFDLDKYNIRADAATELDKIVKIMNANPNMVVELRSYCDCRDTKEYNQILSDNRAQASADYIKKRITNPSRISGKGYGETHLVNGCDCDGDAAASCSEAEHQKNRRTEFIIIKQ
jgi:outer membrane protein OmpA-like peptidoglycan-associated protein/tetratricopeptide (TPR) repeat protein